MSEQWIFSALFSPFNFFSFDLICDLQKSCKNSCNNKTFQMTFTWISQCWYFTLIFLSLFLSFSFPLGLPLAPFLPEYVKSFWIRLQTWCIFTLKILQGISLCNHRFSQVLSWLQPQMISKCRYWKTSRQNCWVFPKLLTQEVSSKMKYIFSPPVAKFWGEICYTAL